MDLASAKQTPLLGQPESWDGYGRTMLEAVPDGILRKARAFFKRVDQPNDRTREQVKAIEIILADREAHHPQQSLSL